MLAAADHRADLFRLLTTACAELDLRASNDSERALGRTAFPGERASLADPAVRGFSQ